MAELTEYVLDLIREHADVVRGHDAVHPDRNDCGGVGGCALMRAEHDAEVAIIAALVDKARQATGGPMAEHTNGPSQSARDALEGVQGPNPESSWSQDLQYAAVAAAVSIAESLDAMRRSPEFTTALRCVPQVAMLLEQLNFPKPAPSILSAPFPTTLAEVEEAVRPYADTLVASGAESDLTGAYHRIGSLLSQWAEPEPDPAF